MSALVKLATKMPGDPETNGVDSIATQLVDDPDTLRCAIVWFDTSKVTIDTDSGDVGAVDEGIVNAVQAAVEKRTGRKAIPFGLVEVSEDGAYGDPQQITIDDLAGVVDDAIKAEQ